MCKIANGQFQTVFLQYAYSLLAAVVAAAAALVVHFSVLAAVAVK
jgi:hypothetical protein